MTDIVHAAVILPCFDGKILMQLRDNKPGIVFPGQWGFFSGAVEDGETPLECAKREIYEELGYNPDVMYPLSVDTASVPTTRVLYSYYCHIKDGVEALTLNEGYDMKLVSMQEISSQQLYSAKANRYFSVISHDIILQIANKCFSCLAPQSNYQPLAEVI